MQCLGLTFAFCVIVVASLEKDFFNQRKAKSFYPTECCICDDNSPDPSLHCSVTNICEKSFTRCDYCETVRSFTGTNWTTTRRCSDERNCVANWYQTVTELGCIDNSRGEPPAGTTCYTCCRTPSPLQPHYCTVSPDTHFIKFNITTVPTTVSTQPTTMSTNPSTMSTMSTTVSTTSVTMSTHSTTKAATTTIMPIKTSTQSTEMTLTTTDSTQNSGPLCYDCNAQSSPDQCKNIVQCRSSEVCTIFHDTAGYSSKCIDRQLCAAAKNLAGPSKCWECCETSLCNDFCSVSVGTSTPTIASAPTKPVTKATATPNSPQTIDGGWSAWGPWQGCDATCDGRRVRVRFCNNPVPSLGGTSCLGLGFEEEKCGLTNCPSGGVSIVG